MLNRRLLRIKVMQSLYSYHQAVGADFMLAQDRIAAAFEPDLTAKEAPDRRKLEGQRKLGEAQLRDWYRSGTMPEKTDDKAVDKAVADAINSFQNQVKKDADLYAGQLMVGAESIHDQYLHLLNLPKALLGVLEEEQSREERRRGGPSENALDTKRLHQNKAIAKLMANEQLQNTTIRRKLAWEGAEEYEALTAAWQEMKADETIVAYLNGKDTDAPELDYNTDLEILRHIYKDFVFKGEALPRQLEAADLNWEENRPIVRNLVLKTLKMLPFEATETQELMNLSANWQDDREFAETLYKQTLIEDDKMEKLIAGSVQNWDVERVALLDKIILKMALTEMQLFRGIPVKVTINEYIEISKLYSTPKSKQFVNGILDKLATDLAASGDIRKSGRGLLDNQ
ncbi:transcription antitermination factor NusB [Hymenobacter properus]|uniref:Transcription antitermination protein NusB n=1 Tax=Hymenobacter properus TaxID=2791026 RepID=A0A931BNX9_9BACT|nr:transcription antitermination factor NusB [Hymenobacter properus]MBF9142900.1 transcription antitermination factor NusB [Hymenobacter properus]MBR7721707.1 transcription antitermination factor NusB [Microvirga sp. SRT04]